MPELRIQPQREGAYSVYAVSRACLHCGADISRLRPQARFCSDQHRAAFRNNRRKVPARLTVLKYKGDKLVFTCDELAAARRRALELEAKSSALLKRSTLFGFREVMQVVGVCSRESIYNLLRRDPTFPRPILFSAVPRRVIWRAGAVERWLKQGAEANRRGPA